MSVPVPVILAPPVQQPQPRNLEAKHRKLAVTQFVIGGLTSILGFVALQQEFPVLSGIWSGVWIAITGSIGICATRNNLYNNLDSVYLVFSIISSIITGAAIIANGFTMADFTSLCYRCHYNFNPGHTSVLLNDHFINSNEYYCEDDHFCIAVGYGLHIPLEILLAIEFFVSIFAAVYCCQNSYCCRQEPMMSSQMMMMIQQQPNTTTGGMMVVYPQHQQMVPQQQMVLQQHGGLPMYVVHGAQVHPSLSSTQQPEPVPGPTFGYDEPPPAYTTSATGV